MFAEEIILPAFRGDWLSCCWQFLHYISIGMSMIRLFVQSTLLITSSLHQNFLTSSLFCT